MTEVSTEEHKELAGKFRSLAIYREAEDLINIGAYASGSNPQIDNSIRLYPQITEFLQQGVTETAKMPDTLKKLKDIFNIES